jgi:HEAT repeat protein
LDPKVQTESLKSNDYRVRGLAAHHLGNIGADAAEAVPHLEKLAKDDPEAKVRQNAAKALQKIRAAQGQD